MTIDIKKTIDSRAGRKILGAGAILVALFLLANYLLIPWYVNQGGVVTVPGVVGLRYEDAERLLDSMGFAPRKGETRMDREHPAGVVVVQNPLEGSKVKRGRRVYLMVSGGELTVTVPNVRGRTLRDARFALEKEGLKLGGVEYAASEEFPANTVVEQKISPGSRVKRDVYVSLVVSQGSVAQKVTVPDVTGKNLAEAKTILAAAGLTVGNITEVPSIDLLPNTIVDQYPRTGELVPSGQAIDLFVVQGAEKKKEVLEN